MLGSCFVGLMMANEEGCVDKYLKLLSIPASTPGFEIFQAFF